MSEFWRGCPHLGHTTLLGYSSYGNFIIRLRVWLVPTTTSRIDSTRLTRKLIRKIKCFKKSHIFFLQSSQHFDIFRVLARILAKPQKNRAAMFVRKQYLIRVRVRARESKQNFVEKIKSKEKIHDKKFSNSKFP